MTSSDRFNWILENLTKETGDSSRATLAWAAIANAPPETRYSLLVDTAASVGVENWSCSAAESIVHEAGVSK